MKKWIVMSILTVLVIGMVAVSACMSSGSAGFNSAPNSPTTSPPSPISKSPDSHEFYNFSLGKESMVLAQIISDQPEWDIGGTFHVKGVVESQLGSSTQGGVGVTVYDNNGVKIGTGRDSVYLDPKGKTAFDVMVFGIGDYRYKGIVYRIDMLGK